MGWGQMMQPALQNSRMLTIHVSMMVLSYSASANLRIGLSSGSVLSSQRRRPVTQWNSAQPPGLRCLLRSVSGLLDIVSCECFLRVDLVYQPRPVPDGKDEVAGKDEVERVLSPGPLLLNVVELEAAIWRDPTKT